MSHFYYCFVVFVKDELCCWNNTATSHLICLWSFRCWTKRYESISDHQIDTLGRGLLEYPDYRTCISMFTASDWTAGLFNETYSACVGQNWRTWTHHSSLMEWKFGVHFLPKSEISKQSYLLKGTVKIPSVSYSSMYVKYFSQVCNRRYLGNMHYLSSRFWKNKNGIRH